MAGIWRRRWLRSGLAGVVSFAIFSSVVGVPSQTDGREATCGSAGRWWRMAGRSKQRRVALVEHADELTAADLASRDPRSLLSVVQAPGVVAVVDETESTVVVVDPATLIERSISALP